MKILANMLLAVLISVSADPICDLISATNIKSISGYHSWSCSTTGCVGWPGLTCIGANKVLSIDLANVGLSGTLCYFAGTSLLILCM